MKTLDGTLYRRALDCSGPQSAHTSCVPMDTWLKRLAGGCERLFSCFAVLDKGRQSTVVARAFRRYSEDYVVDEDAAWQSRATIWSGDIDMPWDWRAQRRSR